MCVTLVSLPTNALAAANVGTNQQPLKGLTPVLDKSKIAPAIAPSASPRTFKIHAGVSQEYVLGPGDVMAITDTSEDKAAVQTVPILPDGTAVTTYTGVIQASGLTLREMNELINSQANKWYVNPHLMVNLAKQRPTQIYLLGEVDHPGLYSVGGDSGMMAPTGGNDDSAEGALTGAGGGGGGGSAGMGGALTFTLSAALQMAGGLKETADVRHLRVTRLAPKQTFQVDLWKLMIDGDVSEDLTLQPGDVIYVPKGGADFDSEDLGRLASVSKKVRIFGAVKAPGLLTLAPDDDLMNAIAKAGGFSDNAVKKYIILARTNHDGTVTSEKINFKKGFKDGHAEIRTKVRSGDLIVVKQSATRTVAIASGRMLPQMVAQMAMYMTMYKLLYKQ